jgi:hypothetical protein
MDKRVRDDRAGQDRAAEDRERLRLRAYLLGELAEPEAEALDERLFNPGDGLLEDLEDEQHVLIDEFAGGLLSGREQERFEGQCARSPQLGIRVDEARVLLAGLAARQSARQADREERHRPRWLAVLTPALGMALCLALFFAVEQSRVNRELRARLDAASTAPAAPAATQRVGGEFVAFLAANVMRGDAAVPRLAVPASASEIELQVEVHEALAGDWNVKLMEGGHGVWLSDRVPMRRVGAETFLDLHLDAAVLPPGDYALELAPQGDPRAEQNRQFSVARGK